MTYTPIKKAIKKTCEYCGHKFKTHRKNQKFCNILCSNRRPYPRRKSAEQQVLEDMEDMATLLDEDCMDALRKSSSEGTIFAEDLLDRLDPEVLADIEDLPNDHNDVWAKKHERQAADALNALKAWIDEATTSSISASTMNMDLERACSILNIRINHLDKKTAEAKSREDLLSARTEALASSLTALEKSVEAIEKSGPGEDVALLRASVDRLSEELSSQARLMVNVLARLTYFESEFGVKPEVRK